MDTNRISSASIFLAIRRARFPILTMALTYLVAVLVGIGMAHSGSDPTITAMQNGQPLLAALSDFSSNLFLGSVPSTLGGLGVIFPYPLAAYCGWVGGIVSVDENHASRLAQPGDTIYYLVTLVLQLIPYSLAGGPGVHLGLAYYRIHSRSQAAKWYEFPWPALLDVARIYLLVVTLFLIASLWEFLVH